MSRSGGAPLPPAGAVWAGRARGYALVVVSYFVMGSIGVLVNLSYVPESMLLVASWRKPVICARALGRSARSVHGSLHGGRRRLMAGAEGRDW